MQEYKEIIEKLDELGQRMDKQNQRIDRLDQRMDALSVIIENTVCGQLKILAEGHATILETLAPKSKTEELEEVDFLKAIVRAQAVRIDALEKKLA